jgi:hypothetical protein
MNSPDPSLFFQIAAGLIPALLLGGSISDATRVRRRHVGNRRHPMTRGNVIFFACLTACFAETYAIAGALGSPIDKFGVYLVATVIVAATNLIALTIFWPWIALEERGTPSWLTKTVVGGGMLALTATSVSLLASSVDLATQRQKATAAQDDLARRAQKDPVASVGSLALSQFDAEADAVRAQMQSGTIGQKAGARELEFIAKQKHEILALLLKQAVATAADQTAQP